MTKLNPLNLFFDEKKGSYSLLPSFDSEGRSLSFGPLSPRSASPRRWGLRRPAFSSKAVRFTLYAVALILCLGGLLHNQGYKVPKIELPQQKHKPHAWEKLPRINGYYNGLRTLVRPSEYVPDYPQGGDYPTTASTPSSEETFFEPQPFDPYPNYTSPEYTSEYYPVRECFLDDANTILPPSILAYPGLPQSQTAPQMGSYKVLGIRDDVCYERYGRFGAYGYGYDPQFGGTGLGMHGDREGSDAIWMREGQLDWRGVNWGQLQDRCYAQNKKRFVIHGDHTHTPSTHQLFDESAPSKPVKRGINTTSKVEKKQIGRTALVLRTWMDFNYDPQTVLSLRAMISELVLKSNGEFGVHLLVHVKDNNLPIWASDEAYQEVLNRAVPEEFRGLVTLWSERQMEIVYPGGWGDVIENPSKHNVHSAYRSLHFPLQYFASRHPEYEHFWNWEMDVRYSGHYYELFDKIGKWARAQPRKGLWERNAKFYIPALHESWEKFAQTTELEALAVDAPAWGPVDFPGKLAIPGWEDPVPPTTYAEDQHSWGVGEDADIITFNPMFDPNGTTWVFRDDVTGWSKSQPTVPRRVALVTVSRMSRRLLLTMHEEAYRMHHTMFSEMWPAACAYQHGLKGVFAPHPLYFDRQWPMDMLDRNFNGGRLGTTGGNSSGVFGENEHRFQGSTFYYNAGFAGALWRRWLGFMENGEGGARAEIEGTGRMCLRGTLVHPIKHEWGPLEP
ncbi:MAG: hypothetical protein M1819_007083 [Sarea resinae]|nr:MAG: hypothetical protein M1819_007083 [Sarea resinae]